MIAEDLLGSDISPDENQSSEILPGICPKYICRARRELKKVNLIEFKNLICGLFSSQISAHNCSFITDKVGGKEKEMKIHSLEGFGNGLGFGDKVNYFKFLIYACSGF